MTSLVTLPTNEIIQRATLQTIESFPSISYDSRQFHYDGKNRMTIVEITA